MRQIFLSQRSGQRQCQEVLTGVLMSGLIHPHEMWIVSPWLSDFEVVDNRLYAWQHLVPTWPPQWIGFVQVVAQLIQSQNQLFIVSRNNETSRKFVQQLHDALPKGASYHLKYSEDLHTKGIVTEQVLVSGSLNLTFSGTNRNDELIHVFNDPQMIRGALAEFEHQYRQQGMQQVVR